LSLFAKTLAAAMAEMALALADLVKASFSSHLQLNQ
jgi:hypothetical protein